MFLILKNNLFKKGALVVTLLLLSSVIYAQEDKEKKAEQFINYEEPDFLLEKDTITSVKKKKKKRKKKTFNGIKACRAFTRKGTGKRQTVELFFYLKKYKEPDSYVKEIYLYEVPKLRIVKVKDYSKKKYPSNRFKVLHGTYVKKQDTVILTEGYFYVGTKHHRWEFYKRGLLVSKDLYHKGFPAEAKLSYYDADKKRLREVIPYKFGEKTGNYYFYFQNGTVKEKGTFENGKKIGKWYEYIEYRHRKKKITQFPKDSYDETTKPIVLNEWDEEGKVLIGRKKKKEKRKKLGSKH